MKNDLITIFNQLTSSELADYTLFSHIIENHYEKFKYLYHLIDHIDLNQVSKIYCTENVNSIITHIEVPETKYLNNLILSINDNRSTYTFSDFFKLDLIQSNDKLILKIKMDSKYTEDDIYANRFV